jgi:hypothetical protein
VDIGREDWGKWSVTGISKILGVCVCCGRLKVEDVKTSNGG